MAQLEPVTLAKSVPPWTYLGVAESLLTGVAALAKHENPGLALSVVATLTLESTLKAYLSRDGDDARLKKTQSRHNIEELWKLATTEGLRISFTGWVADLSHLHNARFNLRYSSGIHGIVTPAPEPMTTELGVIIGTVRHRLQTSAKVKRTSSRTISAGALL